MLILADAYERLAAGDALANLVSNGLSVRGRPACFFSWCWSVHGLQSIQYHAPSNALRLGSDIAMSYGRWHENSVEEKA